MRGREETKRICGGAEHRTSNSQHRTSNLEAGLEIFRPSRFGLLSHLRVSAFGFRGCWIRDVDTSGWVIASLPRPVSYIETPEPGVYGTRMVPGWFQGASSEVPGEDRSGPLLLSFQMLMLLRWAFGRGSLRTRKSKPSEATPRPHQCDIKATSKPVDSQAIGTPKPPQGYPKATSRLPQSHRKAPPKLQQGYPCATLRPLRLDALPELGIRTEWRPRWQVKVAFRHQELERDWAGHRVI